MVEWYVHKHLMHINKPPFGQRHMTHHSLTLNDMTIKRFKNNNIKRKVSYEHLMKEFDGLYFLWPSTLTILMIANIICFIINYLTFNVNGIFIFILTSLYILYQSALWNCLHPMIHYQERRLKWNEGIDIIKREWLKDTGFYRFLWKNHVIHHLNNGYGNYCVTLPFADILFRTYTTNHSKFILNPYNYTIKKRIKTIN